MPKGKPSITALDKKIAKLQQLKVKREVEIKEERKPLDKTIADLEGDIKTLEDKIAPTAKQIEAKKAELAKAQKELDTLLGVSNPKSGKGTKIRLTDAEKTEVDKLFKAKVKDGAKKGKAMKAARAEVLAKRS